MKRFISITILCILSMYIVTSAKESDLIPAVKSTCIAGTPSADTYIRNIYLGTTRVKLARKNAVTCWVRFIANESGTYSFTFSDVKQNLKKTKNKPAIICFYDKYYNCLLVDGLSCSSNGFALPYNKSSANLLKNLYTIKTVSVSLDKGDVVNICCDNILTMQTGKKGSKASYLLEVSKVS